MKCLILVVFSFLFGCTTTITEKKNLDFPIDISGYYPELMKSSKHPFWGGPIKVFELGETVLFQITGSRDFFVINTTTKSLGRFYPNPPDTVSGGVFRYNPVSMVFPVNSGFKYLQNRNKIISFDIPEFYIESDSLNGNNLQNPSKILHVSEEIMISHWWGSSLQDKSSTGGVFLTDLKKNSSKRIILNSEIENFADLIVSDGKIYVLAKYIPAIRVFNFDGMEIQTLKIPNSKFLKFKKLEKPKGYSKFSAKEKVEYLEDYCLDLFQRGDTLAFLHLVYSADVEFLKEEYVLSILNKGELAEKKLDFKPLNFNSSGELYFINGSDSLHLLMKKSLKSFF
ncbi:hypothetical protein [Algoriphagus sp.]|uniref:hypothetical protein n=1 Tax=Algoriphagus sp. TaxID=1872435 RepID=UPI00391D43DC